MKKPVKRVILLEEALSDLMEAETILASLERRDVFLAFTAKQKQDYYDTLSRTREINDVFRGRSIEDLTYFAHHGYFPEDADPKLQSNPSKTSSGQPASDFNNTEKLGCGLEGINSGK